MISETETEKRSGISYRDDGKTLTVMEPGYPTSTFRLVDVMLNGYMVWNIGRHHMPAGYLPLCRLAMIQPFPGARNIEEDTLCAIKIDGAELILDAVAGGTDTLEKMEAFADRNCNAKPGTWEYAHLERVRKAIPVMRRLA